MQWTPLPTSYDCFTLKINRAREHWILPGIDGQQQVAPNIVRYDVGVASRADVERIAQWLIECLHRKFPGMRLEMIEDKRQPRAQVEFRPQNEVQRTVVPIEEVSGWVVKNVEEQIEQKLRRAAEKRRGGG